MRTPGLLQFNKIKSLFLYLIVITLSGCVDLSGSRSTYTAITHSSSANKHEPLKKGQVHTMRGGLGIFSIGMNQLRDKVSDRYKMQAYSTMWYNAGDVTRFIVKNYYKEKVHSPIILVGHSLGANEQIKVARNLNELGIPVALLVTVDAVSQTIVPPNVHYALNVYKPGYVPMFSGLKLRAVNPDKTIINNLNVNSLKEVQVNHFTIDKDKVVQAIILDKVDKVLINGKQKHA
ncbi:MAG TPA: hypothetical protein PK657_14230 [Legionella sp.]|nr:hypothetical protein [Legionella sp.]